MPQDTMGSKLERTPKNHLIGFCPDVPQEMTASDLNLEILHYRASKAAGQVLQCADTGGNSRAISTARSAQHCLEHFARTISVNERAMCDEEKTRWRDTMRPLTSSLQDLARFAAWPRTYPSDSTGCVGEDIQHQVSDIAAECSEALSKLKTAMDVYHREAAANTR